MSDACCLQEFKSCCCTCASRLTDYHHCTTSPELRKEVGGCVCDIVKGFICMAPELNRQYSGWSEHGMCEMWSKRKEAPAK